MPVSMMARGARITALQHASVCGMSAARLLVVRRLWLSSTTTTPQGSEAMHVRGEAHGSRRKSVSPPAVVQPARFRRHMEVKMCNK